MKKKQDLLSVSSLNSTKKVVRPKVGSIYHTGKVKEAFLVLKSSSTNVLLVKELKSGKEYYYFDTISRLKEFHVSDEMEISTL